MKKVRTIRIDKDVSDRLDSICTRHGDISWHIENALRNYFPNKAGDSFPGKHLQEGHESVLKQFLKIEKTPSLNEDGHEFDQLFEMFWLSGIRKVNKKKAKSLFNNLLKKNPDKYPATFTKVLVDDIQKRLNSNQLGFAEMHPTTYLNGERWNDEVTTNGQQNQSGRTTAPSRQTPAQRTRAAAERWEAEQEGNVQALGSDAGSLRPPVEQSVRGGADRDMGAIIDGDYSRAD